MNKKKIVVLLLFCHIIIGSNFPPLMASPIAVFVRSIPNMLTDNLNINKIINYQKIQKQQITSNKTISRYVHLAGKLCPKTGIRYNIKGYPIFEKVSVCNLQLPKNIATEKDRNLHFRVATRILRKGIEQGKIDSSKFNSVQLKAINAGEEKIPGYTWHHHQKFGMMQAIPEEIHKNTPHEGGYSAWYK
ncbi:MAG: HNH endonuclease [Alphaproteobacteria bacterium]|nr:HNH endonuclease [Alphaproteobacteria bacterium]